MNYSSIPKKIFTVLVLVTIIFIVLGAIGLALLLILPPDILSMKAKETILIFFALPTLLIVIPLIGLAVALYIALLPLFIALKIRVFYLTVDKQPSLIHKILFTIPGISLLLFILAWKISNDLSIPRCDILTFEDFGKTKFYRSLTGLVWLPSILTFISGWVLSLILYIKNKDKIALFAFKIIIVFLGALWVASTIFIEIRPAVRSGVDSKRIADIRGMQPVLEVYHAQYKTYPAIVGESSSERWSNLGKIVEAANIIGRIPHDPCANRTAKGDHEYDYKSSPDGSQYVLKALLSDPAQYVLRDDVDGEVLGLWCGKQGREIEFCIKGQ